MGKIFTTGVIIGCALALLFLPRILGEAPFIVHEVEAAVAPQPQPVAILAFGDLMLDRDVRQDIDAQGPMYPFEKIAPLLQNKDIVVANAEGVFTANASVATPTNLVFTFATSTLPTLKQLGFTILSQANNHALNFGWAGLAQSKQWMSEAGIQSFGDPDNVDPGPQYIDVRGTKVAFVGYDQFSSSGGDASSTLAAIRTAHQSGAFTIVYPHWGIEYNLGTTSLQESLAHQFIDAGADAVLGGHPHVVEPTEIYKGKAIFYSMGNFIFDQAESGPTSQGIAIELSLTSQNVTYTVLPISIEHAQATPDATSTSFTLSR